MSGASAHPLQWPAGWNTTSRRQRSAYQVTFGRARSELLAELRRMNAQHIVISTNLPLRRDGLPYANSSEPDNPGVAVYFVWRGEQRVIACDCWDRVKDNLRAIGLTIGAMRMLERCGASAILDRAFAGFTALPQWREPHWREVLGVGGMARWDEVHAAYMLERARHHPDKGGDPEKFVAIQKAWEAAQAELLGDQADG